MILPWTELNPSTLFYYKMDSIVNVSICVDNAAFGETYKEQAIEVSRILKEVASKIERNSSILNPLADVSRSFRDVNGNTVGSIEIHYE